ncbi:Uncharacterised protein [BD1-7 clade bacterium]|uniref:Uncharacterized protein n=1 Tax=BD1-7 clade bacterium TaxID=2029982 RepID=A0A5S9PDF9_9GAMM|nr:Uncharacterised protein [BD1-7 clade bacterium]
MILSRPFESGGLVDFEIETGRVINDASVSGKPIGSFHQVGDFCITLYCESGSIFLQIGRERWDLSDNGIELRYFHIIARRRTFFSIDPANLPISIEYDAWWADIPGFEPVEPEMDQDEDFLGYVYYVWQEKTYKNNCLVHGISCFRFFANYKI